MTRFLAIISAVFAVATLSTSHAQDAAVGKAATVAPTPMVADGKKVRRAVPDTLMFTIDELNDIKDRMVGGQITAESKQQAANIDSIYLGSIMYYGPKDWTIWVNGSPIGPNLDFQAFQVTQISSRHVELLVPLSVQGMRPVRLEPNQTFISASGIVVEGKYP